MKKNNDFFTADENEPDSMIPEFSEVRSSADNTRSGNLKKQAFVIAVVAVVLIAALLTLRYFYYTEAIKGNQYYPDSWVNKVDPDRKPVLKFYEADWETDIMTIPEYLDLRRDILYSPNDSQTIAVPEGQYLSQGGKGLAFMADYINTVIAGDHERLNSLFTDEYFQNNSRYEDFPQQKIFDIKIKKYPYHDNKYDSTTINDEYYIISYKIYRNDGLFRDDIDEESELAQLFELLIYSDGSVKIDNVIDLPGYFN